MRAGVGTGERVAAVSVSFDPRLPRIGSTLTRRSKGRLLQVTVQVGGFETTTRRRRRWRGRWRGAHRHDRQATDGLGGVPARSVASSPLTPFSRIGALGPAGTFRPPSPSVATRVLLLPTAALTVLIPALTGGVPGLPVLRQALILRAVAALQTRTISPGPRGSVRRSHTPDVA